MIVIGCWIVLRVQGEQACFFYPQGMYSNGKISESTEKEHPGCHRGLRAGCEKAKYHLRLKEAPSESWTKGTTRPKETHDGTDVSLYVLLSLQHIAVIKHKVQGGGLG